MKIQQFKNLHQPPTPEQVDQGVRDASKQMEGQFLREMVRQMRSTVSDEGGFIPTSSAEKIFREQLDEQYVEKWGDKGGIGLADLIHDQIIDKYGAMMGLKPQESRPMGPIKIDNQKSSHGALKIETPNANHFVPVAGDGASGSPIDKLKALKTTMKFDLQKAALQDAEVSAPWSGTLIGSKSLSADEHVLEMAHDNGLKSQMVFRGRLEKDLQPSQMKPGAEIQAGQRLGLLSPEAKSFFWTVDVNASL